MTDGAGSRLLVAAIWLLVAAIVGLSLVRAGRSYRTGAHLGAAEGAWIGLAVDASEGVFYRPLAGPRGYGGTRYFPAFFVVEATLIRLGVAPLLAGHLVAWFGVLAAIAAAILLMRRLGVAWATTLGAAALALSAQPTQLALVTVKADALAVAFVLAGAALCVRRPRPVAAAVVFALAFATKPTSLYAAAGACVFLAVRGDRGSAWRLALGTALGAALVGLVMVVVSGGRVVDVFAASAGGGMDAASMLRAPLTYAHMLRRTPETAVWALLVVAWLSHQRPFAVTMPVSLFVAAVLATLVIFASPATIENHLIDVAVIAVIVLAGAAGRGPAWERGFLCLALVTGLAAGIGAWRRFAAEDGHDRRSDYRAVLAVLPDDGPILADESMLAIEAGRPPRILDTYLFSVVAATRPGIVDRLIADIDRRAYRAVVLKQSVPALSGVELLPVPARQRFLAALGRTYERQVVAGRAVFLPRPAGSRAR